MGTDAPQDNSQLHQLGPSVGSRGGPQAASGVTSFICEETTVGVDAYTPPEELKWHSAYQAWRHKGWANIRCRIWKALVRTHQPPTRLRAFDHCCSSATLQVRDRPAGSGQDFRFRSSCCNDRLCTPCATRRAREIQHALHAKLAGVGAPLLITLTLRSEPTEALHALLVRLRTSFRYLRSHPVWEATIKGGAAFLEITRGAAANRWHVHYHIVAEGSYLPQADLSRAWYGITKDSFRVFIERAKSQTNVAYSAKYAAKGVNFQVIKTDAHLDESIMALKGSRLVGTFGSWYNSPFSALVDSELLNEEDLGCSEWSTLCNVTDLLAGNIRIDPPLAAFLNSHGFIQSILRPPSSD